MQRTFCLRRSTQISDDQSHIQIGCKDLIAHTLGVANYWTVQREKVIKEAVASLVSFLRAFFFWKSLLTVFLADIFVFEKVWFKEVHKKNELYKVSS